MHHSPRWRSVSVRLSRPPNRLPAKHVAAGVIDARDFDYNKSSRSIAKARHAHDPHPICRRPRPGLRPRRHPHRLRTRSRPIRQRHAPGARPRTPSPHANFWLHRPRRAPPHRAGARRRRHRRGMPARPGIFSGLLPATHARQHRDLSRRPRGTRRPRRHVHGRAHQQTRALQLHDPRRTGPRSAISAMSTAATASRRKSRIPPASSPCWAILPSLPRKRSWWAIPKSTSAPRATPAPGPAASPTVLARTAWRTIPPICSSIALPNCPRTWTARRIWIRHSRPYAFAQCAGSDLSLWRLWLRESVRVLKRCTSRQVRRSPSSNPTRGS